MTEYVLREPVIAEAIEAATVMCSDPDADFSSPDILFADEEGRVVEAQTPLNFINTTLSDRFRITSYIQSGQFGRGWRARVINTEEAYKDVFIKTLRSPRDTDANPRDHLRMVTKEIKVFEKNRFAHLPRHDNVAITALLFGNVVNALGVAADMFYFVSPDLCESGELYEYLCIRERPFAKNFTEPQARRLAWMLVSGVKFLHDNQVTHRDLKLENLVLDSSFTLKIMDFGSAKWDDEAQYEEVDGAYVALTTTIIGTPCMQPPELNPRLRTLYNPRAFDVWSVGVIIFFLVAMEELVITRLNFSLFQRIKAGQRGYAQMLDGRHRENGVPVNRRFWAALPALADKLTPELKHLLNSIFDVIPTRRITIEGVADHPWFTDGDFGDEEDYCAEMESRPTSATERDRVISIPEELLAREGDNLPNCIEDMIVEACIDMSDADSVEAKQEQIRARIVYNPEMQQFSIGDPVFFLARFSFDAKELCCRWLRGNLQTWFTFYFGLQALVDDSCDGEGV